MVDQPIRKVFVEQERFNTALKALDVKMTRIEENQKVILEEQKKIIDACGSIKNALKLASLQNAFPDATNPKCAAWRPTKCAAWRIRNYSILTRAVPATSENQNYSSKPTTELH